SSIQEGLDAQDDKAMVAVAAGTYVENLYMSSDHSGMHLAGRCRDLVTIDGSDVPDGYVEYGAGLFLEKTGVGGLWTVTGLTVARAPQAGLLQIGGKLVLEDAVVADNLEIGLYLNSGTAEVRDVEISGNTTAGVSAWSHGVTLERVEVRDTRGRGVEAQVGSTLTVTDSTFADNEEFGVVVIGSEGTLTNCDLHDNTVAGLVASESTVEVHGCRVFDSEDLGSSVESRGIAAQTDSVLLVTDSTVESVHGNAISGQVSSSVTLVDCDVLGSRYGDGVYIDQGSTLSASGCVLQGHRGAGIHVDGSQADLEACSILETELDPEGGYAYGAWVANGAEFGALDCVFRENGQFGVTVNGASAELVSCSVLDTRADPDGRFGRGVSVWNDGSLVAEDLVVRGSHEVGVLVSESTAHLTASEISGTRRLVDATEGLGLLSQKGSTVTAEQLTVEDNDGVGVYAVYGSDLSCTDCTLVGNAFANA
ncbi:MAG: right-handed parallel beta-helix repeat-containing protein, partial [Myxococcota bacterium]|nr:right-handed parallel beta-helix repeat-containing protein [Myxococcota bacterium]